MKHFRRQKPQTPTILESKDIPSIAKYIVSDKCQNVVLMLGAGVSTSAGIPDFRSPETGLYANLARLKLPHPEAVFEINFFRNNPVPFYTLAKELYPGKFRPTITHSFIRLLATRSLLHTCFTQNIDTLERRAGVPEEKIIEAHGSFASQRCIDCHAPYDDGKMKDCIKVGQIAICDKCDGLVKPDIVFFGEELPPRFIRAIPGLSEADLLIIIGTSLTVHPFASLAEWVEKSCPRVLINLDPVGDIGSRADDVVLLGKCDEIVTELCKELRWEEELVKAWEETRDGMEVAASEVDTENLHEEERLNQEVANLTSVLGKRLALDDVTAQISLKQDRDDSHDPSSPSFTGQLGKKEDDVPGADLEFSDGMPTKIDVQNSKGEAEPVTNQNRNRVGEIEETKDQPSGENLEGKL